MIAFPWKKSFKIRSRVEIESDIYHSEFQHSTSRPFVKIVFGYDGVSTDNALTDDVLVGSINLLYQQTDTKPQSCCVFNFVFRLVVLQIINKILKYTNDRIYKCVKLRKKIICFNVWYFIVIQNEDHNIILMWHIPFDELGTGIMPYFWNIWFHSLMDVIIMMSSTTFRATSLNLSVFFINYSAFIKGLNFYFVELYSQIIYWFHVSDSVDQSVYRVGEWIDSKC